MKRHAGWMCFCAMLALLLAGGVCAGAETNTHPPQMLAVRFLGVDKDWRNASFDEADTRRQIEERLRRAGYRLVSS